MKLIVAGSRFSDLTAEQLAQLDAIHAEYHVAEVVSGGAKGADRSGELWAESRGIPVRIFKPEWQRYGRAAGPVRNGQMAVHADAAAVFPGGSGTRDMLAKARSAGLRIFDFMNDG